MSEAQARVIAEAVAELPVEVAGSAAALPLAAVGSDSADPDSADPDGAAGGVGSVRLRAEAQLVRWASQFDPGQLGRLGGRIAEVVDPGAAEACEARRLAGWERRAFRRRELTFAD